MSNFSYLSTRPEYSLFANSAIEAEKVFSTSPAMCAVGCRKALELAVKWVYAADKTITMPYKDNLQSLLHEPSFRFAVSSASSCNLLSAFSNVFCPSFASFPRKSKYAASGPSPSFLPPMAARDKMTGFDPNTSVCAPLRIAISSLPLFPVVCAQSVKNNRRSKASTAGPHENEPMRNGKMKKKSHR